MSLKGPQSDQLATLEQRFNALRRDIDLLQARPAATSPKAHVRLARIEGSPSAGDNTYSITFLDGTFTETAGNQTPIYTDRQSSPVGFAHNVIASPTNDPANGDIILIWRWSERWWFEAE